jgi:hypothetical protein
MAHDAKLINRILKQLIFFKMEANKLREEITQLIDNIKERSDSLKEKERIPQLELEMVLSKIKKLYEKSIIFNHIYHQEFFGTKKSSFEKEFEKPHQPEEVLTTANITVTDNNVQENSEEKTIIEVVTEKHQKTAEPSSKSSLNEHIGKNKLYASVSSKLQQKPIIDLVKAIGINEKFQYTKELFKGNAEAFSESVKKLNSFSNLSEAENYIHSEIFPKYNWDPETSPAKDFLDLVQRRYL